MDTTVDVLVETTQGSKHRYDVYKMLEPGASGI